MAGLNSDYYGGVTPDQQRARQQQAMQSALIGDQNIVDVHPAASTVQPEQHDPAPGDPHPPPTPGAPPTTPTTPTGGIPPPAPAPPPQATTNQQSIEGSYTYEQALGWTNSRAQSLWGRALSAAEIEQMKHDLGFTPGAPISGSAMGPIQNWLESHKPATTGGGTPPPGGGGAGGGGGTTPPTNWQDIINGFLRNLPNPQQQTLPTTGLPTYRAPQLMSPDAQNAENQQFHLLQSVLSNPDVYSEENVRQLQESQKETALATQHQAQQQLANRYAAMGRTGSGQLDANNRRLTDQTLSTILAGNRDINSQTTAANFNSKLGALSSANSVIGESVNRRGAQANQDFLAYGSDADRVKFALSQALSQAGLNQQTYGQQLSQQQLALSGALGTGSLDLDKYKSELANNLNWYQAISGNDNFLKQLLAQIAMFNAQQTNTNNTRLI